MKSTAKIALAIAALSVALLQGCASAVPETSPVDDASLTCPQIKAEVAALNTKADEATKTLAELHDPKIVHSAFELPYLKIKESNAEKSLKQIGDRRAVLKTLAATKKCGKI